VHCILNIWRFVGKYVKYNRPKCIGISACKLGGDLSPLKKYITLENAKMAYGFIQILWWDLNRKSDRIFWNTILTFSDTRCSEFRTTVIVTTHIQQNQERDVYQSIIILWQYLILEINDRRVEKNQQTVRKENNITLSLHDTECESVDCIQLDHDSSPYWAVANVLPNLQVLGQQSNYKLLKKEPAAWIWDVID